MDGPIEHYHRQLASMQNQKDRVQLEGVQKFYDRCKEEKSHAYSIEERDLRKSLMQLKKEKEYNKRRGSCLSDDGSQEPHVEKCKDRKPKGVIVKLQPGRIDTERMSPPNSHDVAVRMLFDKKGPNIKKGKKSKRSTENLTVPGPIGQSKSHKEAMLKLPNIEKRPRRKSFDDTKDYVRKDSFDQVNTTSKPPTTKHSTTSRQIYDLCLNPEIIVSPDAHLSKMERTQDALRKHMKTPTPDKMQQSPPLTPQKAWGAFSSNINVDGKGTEFHGFGEIEKVAQCNKARLPKLPTSKTSLIDSRNELPAGYSRDHQKSSSLLGHTFKDQTRRGSMDYREMDFLERSHSFVPANVKQRRTSFGSHDQSKYKTEPQVDEPHYQKKQNKHRMTDEMLEHYYTLLAENQKLLLETDSNFSLPPQEKKHIPICTLKRSQRRKTLALEVLLKQLPSYKHVAEMNPKEMLDCRYLRLSKNNIEELEDLCRSEGQDPGIHAHMTAQEVEDYFDQLDNASEGSESLSDLELSPVTSGYNNPISTHCYN